jgi:hypothetical protein
LKRTLSSNDFTKAQQSQQAPRPLSLAQNPFEQDRLRIQKVFVKSQLKELNHFFIASTIYYIFLIVFCCCSIPITVSIFVNGWVQINFLFTQIFYVILFFCVSTGSLSYALRRIYWLLV